MVPIFPSWRSSLASSSHDHHIFLKKKYVARRLGPFDVQKVSKTQKIHENMVSCCADLKPKLRGLFRK
jgi:hypothetical protein